MDKDTFISSKIFTTAYVRAESSGMSPIVKMVMNTILESTLTFSLTNFVNEIINEIINHELIEQENVYFLNSVNSYLLPNKNKDLDDFKKFFHMGLFTSDGVFHDTVSLNFKKCKMEFKIILIDPCENDYDFTHRKQVFIKFKSFKISP